MPKTYYIWDDDAVIAETNDQGTVTVSYTREPDEFGSLISQTQDGETHYFHYDALGSTAELTDSTETVTDTFRFSAFGEEVHRTGTTETPYTWLGNAAYQQQEGSLIYVRRRYITTDIGRWASSDPAGFIDGPNRYRYTYNNPISFTDPTGLAAEPDSACSASPTIPEVSSGDGYCFLQRTTTSKWTLIDWWPSDIDKTTLQGQPKGAPQIGIVKEMTCLYTRKRQGCYKCTPCCFPTPSSAAAFNNTAKVDSSQGGAYTHRFTQKQLYFAVFVPVSLGTFLSGKVLPKVVNWLTGLSVKVYNWNIGEPSERDHAKMFCESNVPSIVQPDPLPNGYSCEINPE